MLRTAAIAGAVLVTTTGAYGAAASFQYSSGNIDCFRGPVPGLRASSGGMVSPSTNDLVRAGWRRTSVPGARRILPFVEMPQAPLANYGTLETVLVFPKERTVTLRFRGGVIAELEPPRTHSYRETFIRGLLAETRGVSCGEASRDISWIAIAPGYQRGMGGERLPRPALIDFMNDRLEVTASTYRYSANELFPVVASILQRQIRGKR